MSKRILIADDHELVRRGIRNTVNGKYEICGEAADGREAVEKTVALKPDLVILDITMPLLNGLDAARQIRGAIPAIKILLVSMHDYPQLEMGAKAAGADGFLSKSAPSGQLMQAIDRLVGVSKTDELPIYLNP